MVARDVTLVGRMSMEVRGRMALIISDVKWLCCRLLMNPRRVFSPFFYIIEHLIPSSDDTY